MEIKKGTRIGPYYVLDALNRGGMGEIYHAHDSGSSEDVALKVNATDHANPRFASALRQEVDILSRFEHPGVVRILPQLLANAKQQVYMAKAINLPSQPWYYVMEYLRGEPLAQVLKQAEKLPMDLAAVIGLHILDALAYIHSLDVAHLDIKPENILFRQPVLKDLPVDPVIIDFGVAASTKLINPTGGTLNYMSPEYLEKLQGRVAPEKIVDLRKVDIYALGVVIYRMWTGRYPFSGMTEHGLTTNVLHSIPQRPGLFNPCLPQEADKLMLEWLAKDPKDRPALADLRDYLIRWSGGLKTYNISLTKHKPAWWPF
jgi:eukaryotic-like serine/threonine-protein kinase